MLANISTLNNKNHPPLRGAGGASPRHGGLNDKNSHAGDLGNIISKSGLAIGSMKTNKISIKGGNRNSVVGRMVIVHKDEDDLGKGFDAESLKTGNAGKRLACGVPKEIRG